MGKSATKGGLPVTVRIASTAEAAVSILWATGSDDHLRALEKRAEAAGLRLDESGLWRGNVRIECADAWGFTRGDPSVKIAVVDTGVRVTHEELEAQVLDPQVA